MLKLIRTITVLLLFVQVSYAQNLIILMSEEPGTASADTIPSQFTFTDVTDAALSSWHQAYIVVAGCDSARFYPASGDSLKLGALGTYDVTPIWADAGDSIYTGLVASGTNSTSTHSIIYSSNGTPYDTFTVTTVAGSDVREGLSPVLVLAFNDDSLVAGGNNKIYRITNNGMTFADDDTTDCPMLTDSSMNFSSGGTKRLVLSDAGGADNIDFGTNDFTIEGWFWFNSASNNIFAKNDSDPNWVFRLNFGEYYFHNFRAATAGETLIGQISGVDNSANNLSGGWHHIAFVWDRNTGAYLYKDGSVVRTEETTEWTDFSATDMDNNGFARFGVANLGHVNVIAIYHSALTPTNISDLYNQGRE